MSLTSLESVVCDLCGSDKAVELYPSTIADQVAPPGVYYSSSRSRAAHGRIVRCAACGLVRTDPRDTAAVLAQVYATLDDPLYDAEIESRARTAREHLALVNRYARPPGLLLDVGCSTGIFLLAAQQQGWQVAGIEPSGWAVELACRRLGSQVVQQAMLEQAIMPPASCDVVTLWDVLEHVASPTAALQRVHGWLKPGGYLFLNVPNAESLIAKLLGSRWVLLLREHLWYYSPATLAVLFKKTGFELVQTRPNFVTFSLRNVLLRLGQYAQKGGTRGDREMRPGGLAAWLGASLRLRFPIGELNAVARRL